MPNQATALSALIKVEQLTGSKYELYEPLCDILFDLAEQEDEEDQVWKLSQMAHSFGHDILNLALLAGRLLWCEGVTPAFGREADLVAIAVDTETYLITLKSACDILAEVFSIFCVDPGRRGQFPKETDSFREIVSWSKENPTRLRENFRFVVNHFDWFMELRSLRDKIVHHGFYSNIYTDRTLFKFFLAPGLIPLRRREIPDRKKEDGQENRKPTTQVPLIPLLKRLTASLLELSEQLATAIQAQLTIVTSKTHVLEGVYVPALRHLLSYEQPTKLDEENPNAPENRRRQAAVKYLFAAYDYLGASLCGYPNGFWWRFLMRLSELFKEPPWYVSRPLFGGAHDALVDWNLIFRERNSNYALSLRDIISLSEDGLGGLRENLGTFAVRHSAVKSMMVANRTIVPRDATNVPSADDFAIIEANPVVAAERVFVALTSPL